MQAGDKGSSCSLQPTQACLTVQSTRSLSSLTLSGFSRRLLGLDAASRRDAFAEAEEKWHRDEDGDRQSADDQACESDAERMAERVERRRLDEAYASAAALGQTKIEQLIASVHRACKTMASLPSRGHSGSDLGLVFANVPRWLIESGICKTPLPCLTGAARTLARARVPAGQGFDASIITMIDEANDGVALLNRLDLATKRWARALQGVDPRSGLPRVAAAFLIMPVLDADWLGRSLGVADRSAERLIKRLSQTPAPSADQLGFADGSARAPFPLIVPWAPRVNERLGGKRRRSIASWVSSDFAQQLGAEAMPGRPPPPVKKLMVVRNAEEGIAASRRVLTMNTDLEQFDRMLAEWDRTDSGRAMGICAGSADGSGFQVKVSGQDFDDYP